MADDRMPWQQVEGACRGCGRTDCSLVKQWKSETAYQDCLARTIARLESAEQAVKTLRTSIGAAVPLVLRCFIELRAGTGTDEEMARKTLERVEAAIEDTDAFDDGLIDTGRHKDGSACVDRATCRRAHLYRPNYAAIR